MGGMAHVRILKLPAMAALIGGAFTALALSSSAGADAPRAETFNGECEMSGTIRHQPGLIAGPPAPTSIHGSFSGVCSGEFTDGVRTYASAR